MSSPLAAQGARPNFILILVDDMGWRGSSVRMDDSIPDSAMPILKMPRLERFASQGMRFRNAYAGAPQCAPARVCIQTGMSAARSGFTVYQGGTNTYPEPDTREPLYRRREYQYLPLIPNISDLNLDRAETTIAEALSPLGYTSAHFGKWHMRGGGGGDHGYSEHDGETDNKAGNQRIPDDPKLIFSITRKSVDFMRRMVAAGRPFYLQVSHYAVHAGNECLPKTQEFYTRHPRVGKAFADNNSEKQRAKAIDKTSKWFGMAEDLDTGIGMVLDAVDELGIARNTYIIVVSDNGYRHHLVDTKEPLRGAKWWLWEGGLRVPMWVRGPGIEPGSVCMTNVVHYDYLPTLVDLAGGSVSALGKIDGVSLKPLLQGRDPGPALADRALYFHYPHYRTSLPSSAIVHDGWKCLHFYETPGLKLLFDLGRDLGETSPAVSARPHVHERLYGELTEYLKDVGARTPVRNPDFDRGAYEKWRKGEGAKGMTSRDAWRWGAGE